MKKVHELNSICIGSFVCGSQIKLQSDAMSIGPSIPPYTHPPFHLSMRHTYAIGAVIFLFLYRRCHLDVKVQGSLYTTLEIRIPALSTENISTSKTTRKIFNRVHVTTPCFVHPSIPLSVGWLVCQIFTFYQFYFCLLFEVILEYTE